MDDNDIKEAIRTLKDGGIVIYPTETCYGIGCDALDEDAVEMIYEIKGRPHEKPLTAIVADLRMAKRYCQLSDLEEQVCDALMPGPLTIVAEKRDRVPDVLNTDFVFRVPDHAVSRKLSHGIDGPVVATSANLSGEPSSYRIEDIDPAVREAADVILDGGELDERPPSTIIDLEGDTPTVHREGPISRDEIQTIVDAVRQQ